jgi:translation initiation factor IF-2
MKAAKIRVYEFARQKNFSAKDLVQVLQEAGFVIKSHMAVLDDEALKFLEKKFNENPSRDNKEQGQVEEGTMASTQQANKKQKPNQKPGKFGEGKRVAREPAKNQSSVYKKEYTRQPEVVEVVTPEPLVRDIIVESMTPGDFALKIGETATGVILTLLKWGIVCPKNQLLPEALVARLANHYTINIVKKPAHADEEILDKSEAEAVALATVHTEKLERRPPVVVVMGHVDHGKTTLLDFIRKTRVAAKEKGGITQHLGAYEVKTGHGNIVFLDTPGHEAFTKIRMRGARVADIVVLVIAADDGVMPQTIEAIRHAKTMKVPIIVAINKVDKAQPHQIEAVRRDLSLQDLLPEEWGGQTVCVQISAKLGQGIDQLLEMISLQAEVMNLEADKTVAASGYVLEAEIEKGRGPVATLICQHGTLKKGDIFLCGSTSGKVNSLVDSYGVRVESAGPSIPVRVAGFDSLPDAGDFFKVVSYREYKTAGRTSKQGTQPGTSRASAVEGDINIIIKTDNDSSREALISSIAKLSKKLEKGFYIVHEAVGDISESDVELAATTGSIIIGLHVKAEPNSLVMARRRDVEIRSFDIIYRLLEDLEAFSESKKEIKKVKTKIGEAVVLRIFDIKNLGVIAGCSVRDGRCTKDSELVVWRGRTKIATVKIKSLQREKKAVKEVHTGFECGFLADGFNDWQVDDRIECFVEMAPGDELKKK